MNLIDIINTGNVILIGYYPECKEYLFSELDKLFNISYVDYKTQIFSRDDYVIDDKSYMRDTKISLIFSQENREGYQIINIDNFNTKTIAPGKSEVISRNMEIRNMIRSISSQSYMWSRQDLKIRTIMISQSYKDFYGQTVVKGGSSVMYSSDLALLIKEVDKFDIIKNSHSPCSVNNPKLESEDSYKIK